MDPVSHHPMADGRWLAYRQLAGRGPALVFLPGYMSDMTGSKAQALFEWARAEGRSCLLLDYSGCGDSSGDFAEGTLGRWRDEVLELIAARIEGPVLLIGSSMGGWLMLLVALELPAARVAGLVGIAAAPDFTDWGLDRAQKAALERGDTVLEENPYGPAPTPTHPGFWADGQARRLLAGEIALDCPARLIQGQRDSDVPFDVSLRLARRLRSEDVQLALVKDGDHRLSRPADIALLLRTVGALLESPAR
jgi:pimeloyl-ACP methyl ester carboxylesterase